MRRLLPFIAAALSLFAALAPSALAGPVASNDQLYSAFGRVFPDPQGGACANAGIGPCSPRAQGSVPATTFLGLSEFEQGLTYMNQKPEWLRYMEVWPLDSGKFPGNNLGKLEFTPDPAFVSAGIPTSTLGRTKHKMYVVRVTDETVPDAGKKRYALSLSIHGIERAGVEGGVRALEDLVTAATTMDGGKSRLASPILTTKDLGVPIPTFGDVLKKAIIYFSFPNPDGWSRGSFGDGGFRFQRYNGNGVDLNRDFRDIGYAFRQYSSLSEPESRALTSFFLDVQDKGGKFAAGDDLHGQISADSFSYTLLPHGSHDFAKNSRLLQAAKTINLVQQDVLSWSPDIQPNDAPVGQCVDAQVAPACFPQYGQTYGTVYDTINYTVTGAIGDFFDSSLGLNADGVDNEMSYSHVAPDTLFVDQIEQLHVDGNVGLIYAHIAEVLGGRGFAFRAKGRKGYVASPRVSGKGHELRPFPPGTKAQADIDQDITGTPDSIIAEFPVKQDAQTFNGGMRVEITFPNVQGNSPSAASATVAVECNGCDEHPGVAGSEGWIPVAQDFNQSPLYVQAGMVVTVNYPQAFKKGAAVKWRVNISTPGFPVAHLHVAFSHGPASGTGNTGGGDAPEQRPYNVGSTDFWALLNSYAPDGNQYEEINPAKALPPLDTLVVTDQVPQTPGFVARAKAFVEAGGNLVLTDAGLGMLPSLFPAITPAQVKSQKQYLGQLAFTKEATTSQDPTIASSTTGDPLAKGLAQPGARFNSGLRRQTFEPVPVGFQITTPTGGDDAQAPQWFVDRAAFEKAGGRVVATGVEPGPAATVAVVPTTVTLGELPLGKGVVRVVGALLPTPTEKFDHNEGLEPHAVTYSGYEVALNLTDYCRPDNTRCGLPFGKIGARDRLAPISRFTRKATKAAVGRRLVLRGTSRDRAPKGFLPKLARVQVAIARRVGSKCRFLTVNGRFRKAASCKRLRFIRAKGTKRWSFRSRRPLPAGRYVAYVRGIDAVGNRERPTKSRNRLRFAVK